MKDYTAAAVSNQLRAMGCAGYVLLMRKEKPEKGDRPVRTDPLTPAEVMQRIPEMKRLNAQGWHVYVQPDPDEQRAVILVDDLTADAVDRMKKLGIEPACVLETSPGSHQVWVRLGPAPMSGDERRLVAKRLACCFGGDLCSAASIHMGRLAGFTNVKEKHRGKGRGGGYPFVLCRESRGVVCREAQNARAWASKLWALVLARRRSAGAVRAQAWKRHNFAELPDIVEKIERYCADWYRRNLKPGEDPDRSRRDITVILRLLRDGYADEQIIHGMQPMIQEECGSGVRQKKSRTYLETTIRKAKDYLN